MKRPVIFWSLGVIAVAICLYAFVIKGSDEGTSRITENKDTTLDPK